MRTYLQLDGAIFLALTADRERKGELVPVLLHITPEPESAYERFNALASYALLRTYVRTYASTDCTGGVGETIKRKGGVSQACLGKSTSFT